MACFQITHWIFRKFTIIKYTIVLSLTRKKTCMSNKNKWKLLENGAVCINPEMVLEYNSQKPFPQQNGLYNFMHGAGNSYAGCWKSLHTSNDFGVQLIETISTAKCFWHNFMQDAGNPYAGCWKPLRTSNGFGVQLTETISGFMQGA